MPAFDNALLGYQDRTRIIAENDRKTIAREASGGVPVFLFGGFARGTWSVDGEHVRIAPFRPLSRSESDAEAERLCAFAGIRTMRFEEIT